MGKLRLAILVSGSGRSLENLAELIAREELDCKLGLVLSDRDGVKALERAERLGIEHVALSYRELGSAQAFSQRAFQEIEARGCNRVVLAGFLRLLKLPDGWEGRVMNIHPSLLPKYGGKGFYGEHVHRAVIEAGETLTGCTVHLIDDHYDQGNILLQREVPVHADDTPETLGARVFEEEKRALPDAIRMWIAEDG
jgi:phosphoribosylglycinamide formyltransferase-1